MDEIKSLLEVNYGSLLINICILCFGIISFCAMIEKISIIIGKPVKWLSDKNKDHILLQQTIDEVKIIKNDCDLNNTEIKKDISKLSDMFLQKQLEDMRWRILDFSSAVSNGRYFNRESYDFIFKTYDRYERILEEHGLENGLVKESMNYVKSRYLEGLRNGEFK